MGNKIGYVMINRSLMTHHLWQEKPFDRGRAWIHMIFMAEYHERKIIHGNKVIELMRGQFFTTERRMMSEFGWGNTKLRSFLDALQIEAMIKVETKQKYSIVTICNYDVYQSPAKQSQSVTKAQAKASPKQTVSSPINKNNNINNKYIIYNSEKVTLPSFINSADWDAWVQYRAEIKKPLTEKAVKLSISKLEQCKAKGYDVKDIIEKSIMNGWAGLFVPDKANIRAVAKEEKPLQRGTRTVIQELADEK